MKKVISCLAAVVLSVACLGSVAQASVPRGLTAVANVTQSAPSQDVVSDAWGKFVEGTLDAIVAIFLDISRLMQK